MTALSLAAGRAELAVVCFLVGAGWPATLLAGGHGLLRGAVILVVALVLLAGATGRGGRFAVPAVAVVVLAADGLSAAPAVAKPGFLANTLTPFVGDANTQTPEFKSFLVKVEKL